MNANTDFQFPGIETELGHIEKEFREIWKNTTDSSNPDAVIKAGTLNLVITCNTAERLPVVLQHVPEITSHHPGRIIIVYINKQLQSEQIRATISAFCQPPRYDGKQICCELICLETGAAGEKHLPGTLLPLLLPDLPVFLWSSNNLVLHSPVFASFHKNIDRIILTTPQFLPTVNEIRELSGAILKTARLSKVSDMNWAALTGWREAVAGFFDGLEGRKFLAGIESIEIRYAGESVSVPGYLLTGWLAFLLKWQFKTSGNDRYTFITPHGNPVVINIEKASSDVFKQGLLAITITVGQESGDKTKFQAEKTTENRITTRNFLNTQILSVNELSFTLPDEAHRLCNELDYLHEDSVYIGAVQIINKILNTENNAKSDIY